MQPIHSLSTLRAGATSTKVPGTKTATDNAAKACASRTRARASSAELAGELMAFDSSARAVICRAVEHSAVAGKA